MLALLSREMLIIEILSNTTDYCDVIGHHYRHTTSAHHLDVEVTRGVDSWHNYFHALPRVESSVRRDLVLPLSLSLRPPAAGPLGHPHANQPISDREEGGASGR